MTAVTRRLLPLLVSLLLAAGGLHAESAYTSSVNPAPPRGGRVGWARLITDDPQWSRHTRSDGELSVFIRRQTSLNLDPVWHSASPANLEALCNYPLLFSTDLSAVKRPAERANLREYFARGGFMLVDACINTTEVNPDPDRFLANNQAAFADLLPGCRIKPLTADHEIYRCYFKPRDTPPHSYMNGIFDPNWAKHPLYGVYLDDRMVAVISLSGLQCGWDHMTAGDHAQQCMQMVVNIYVYAMTR